jgi:hypothetical protein
MSRSQGHSGAGRIRSIEKSSDLIEDRTRDSLACNIVRQPTILQLCCATKLKLNSVVNICS